MKNIIYCFLFSMLFNKQLNAQIGDSSKAAKFAVHISKKMKDTLSLNNVKATEIYLINIDLHNKKANARNIYANDINQLRNAIQKIENTRDSLYAKVLNPQQYSLYKIKKGKLITIN